MLEEVLFITFLLIFVLELILNCTWISFYFRYGIPIFKYEVKRPTLKPLQCDNKEMEKAIPNSIFDRIIIHRLSDSDFAFRESYSLLEIRFSYPPVMRGSMRLTPSGNIRIVGFLNYFPIFLSILIISSMIGEQPHVDMLIPVSFLFVFWGISYVIQYIRFKTVAKTVASLNTDTSP